MTDGIVSNNFIYIIDIEEDTKRSLLELRLDLESPELELEVK